MALAGTAAAVGAAAMGVVLVGKASGAAGGGNWRGAFNPASATTTGASAAAVATPLLLQLRGGVATAAAGQWTWRSVLGATTNDYTRVVGR